MDVNFNCNVVVGSDGMITGAQGGHPDTAAGAKCAIAYSIAGEPERVQFGERVVGIIESRDGTIMDVVRQMKPFEFARK